MSTIDHKRSALTTVKIAAPEPGQKDLRFLDVLKAVNEAAGLTDGVRGNLRSAVERCADLCSKQGVHAVVNVQLIARRLGTLTAAKLGFTNRNSFAAFQSNLRRGLRLAGVTVMPGRHQVPLTAAWASLKERALSIDPFLWRSVSRFVHYLSERGVDPDGVNEKLFARFGDDLCQTCLGSKREQVARNTAKAWTKAQATVPAWPSADLGYTRRKSDTPLLPWSAFPPSLEQDARSFLMRDEDWLSLDAEFLNDAEAADEEKRPLRPATQANYFSGLQRIASILMALGVQPGELKSLADLVQLPRVKAVLEHVSARTCRKKGGHVMFLALLLYMVARDHVGITGKALIKLETWFKKTRPESLGMSDRTLERYMQFDDPAMVDRLVQLPRVLMAEADKALLDISSAKLARLALYLVLLSETCARSGNIVGLNLETHVISGGIGTDHRTFLLIPAHEVKNGVEIRAELSTPTAKMLHHYVKRYPPEHCSQPSPWLFPRQDGSHWSTTQACTDLKDICARRLGVDVTPHLLRSLGGKIILDAHPGAIGTVQQLLGHKHLDTTIRSYVRLDSQKARADYQQLLKSRRGGTGR